MYRIVRQSRSLVVVAGLVLALVTASAAVAVSVTRNGGSVTAVRTVTQDSAATTNSTTWVDLPSMSTTMSVPAGQKALLIITFSGESGCEDMNGTTVWCLVRVVVDGVIAPPGEVRFDSRADGVAWETNSMQFVSGLHNAGQHLVKVQYKVDETNALFTVDSRTLTVLRSKA